MRHMLGIWDKKEEFVCSCSVKAVSCLCWEAFGLLIYIIYTVYFFSKWHHDNSLVSFFVIFGQLLFGA